MRRKRVYFQHEKGKCLRKEDGGARERLSSRRSRRRRNTRTGKRRRRKRTHTKRGTRMRKKRGRSKERKDVDEEDEYIHGG